MAAGESPAVARHRLRLALRRAREAAGLTQRQVADALEWSMSKVNRIESGEVTVSRTDLQALLRLLEVTDTDLIGELTTRARMARQKGWWDRPEFRELLTPAMIQSLQFELDAHTIRSFQPVVVPGLLQTRRYAATILAGVGSEHLTDEVRAARLEVRMRRRERLLNQPDPPTFQLVLDESVLLREVGGQQVMAEQLYDLLERIRSRRVSIRILPMAPTVTYAAFGLFFIFECLDKDVSLVYRESYDADEAVSDPESIDRHRLWFERLWEQSLDVKASTSLIEAHAARLRSEADRLGPES